MKIIMSQKEIDTFSCFLSESHHSFEFGMGGSTVLASKFIKKSIYAIDSDAKWVSKVKEELVNEKSNSNLEIFYKQ